MVEFLLKLCFVVRNVCLLLMYVLLSNKNLIYKVRRAYMPCVGWRRHCD